MLVILDTNIVMSACLTEEGAPATIVKLALQGKFTICVSAEVLAEYREVLAREKFAQKRERIKTLLDGIEEIAIRIAPERALSISPDGDDNRILECAEAVRADFIVTGNAKHFPESLSGTRIVRPREFLDRL